MCFFAHLFQDQEELKAQKEKLRAEVARVQALNADLNTQNETSNEKMEIDMMFQVSSYVTIFFFLTPHSEARSRNIHTKTEPLDRQSSEKDE